jgi:hypothetical protein
MIVEKKDHRQKKAGRLKYGIRILDSNIISNRKPPQGRLFWGIWNFQKGRLEGYRTALNS